MNTACDGSRGSAEGLCCLLSNPLPNLVIAFLLLEENYHLAPAVRPHVQAEMGLLPRYRQSKAAGRRSLAPSHPAHLDQLRNFLLGPGRAGAGSASSTASNHAGQPGKEKAPRPWYMLPASHTFTSLSPLPELSLPLPPPLHTLRE